MNIKKLAKRLIAQVIVEERFVLVCECGHELTWDEWGRETLIEEAIKLGWRTDEHGALCPACVKEK